MIARLTTVGGAAALVATLNVCTAAAPSPAPASDVEHAPTSAVAAPTTTPMSEPRSADVSPTTTAAGPPAVVIAVPPMPPHLIALRPSDDTVGPDDHDHDGEAPFDDTAIAVAWLAAVYTGRYDQPDTNLDVAAGLTDDPALVAGALAALPALDAERLEVRWPIVIDVIDEGDGWWQVTFVVKHTAAGQVGPATSGPYTARVHVAAGRVVGWEPPA